MPVTWGEGEGELPQLPVYAERDRFRKAIEDAIKTLESQGGYYIGSPTHKVIDRLKFALNPESK